jgi:wobble nucleotide-excising tRNase
MTRGPHRTLSDGEKTAIAFCYFVACVHRKVEANSDYRKLFLVFDDPVTSMSYDFVFSIAQTLKNLNISDQGEVSINPGQIDGNKYLRPELLILTHSSYFFNICLTNRIVDERKGAAFALHPDANNHKLVRLKEYVAPFKEQLRDVCDIANGRDPDHRTANSVRSVLEAIGRFCRPDKTESLSTFVQHLAGDEGIAIKSVLINSLCHGTYYEETPVPGDLKLACEETIVVVERFAVGQLELLKGAADKNK